MKARARLAQTMLELVAATTIMGIALVPALRLTRDRIERTEELERAEMRVSVCVSKLEEEMARTVANWDLTDRSGSIATPGHTGIRFVVTKSDSLADGGIPDSLAVVDVTVWHDDDGGSDIDVDEHAIRLATKVARLTSYESAAND
ncbi:MAG: hypothetical protein AAFX06_15590 [Planctomycetota bacterium]